VSAANPGKYAGLLGFAALTASLLFKLHHYPISVRLAISTWAQANWMHPH
jgi:hypothetical protein